MFHRVLGIAVFGLSIAVVGLAADRVNGQTPSATNAVGTTPAAAGGTMKIPVAQAPDLPATPAPDMGLIGELVQKLGVKPGQASGGAGAIFALSRQNLGPEEFEKVAEVVPSIEAMIASAPRLKVVTPSPAPEGSPTSAGTGKAKAKPEVPEHSASMARLEPAFADLGMGPEMAGKFIPVVLGYVQIKGGDNVMGILKGALK